MFATCSTSTDEDAILKYLEDENEHNLPIMWIHIPFEYNARFWSSFGSRSSTNVNQPYIELTLRSIIKNCDNSFKIMLIDDGSFKQLIPNWKIELNKLSDPVLPYVRQLGIAQLIYRYGGMVVPPSFLCFKDLITLYEKGTSNNSMFVGENVNKSVGSEISEFSPDIHLMGANKNSPMLKDYIEFIRRVISRDYTAQPVFKGEFNAWVNERIGANQIGMIPGTLLGTQTSDGEPVLVDNLLSENTISFYDDMYGIWIPMNEILSRRHYEWFARLDAEQIFDSNCILCKYFVLALAPSERDGLQTQKPNWVSFWKTPRASVWGLKPILLGNNIPREDAPYF